MSIIQILKDADDDYYNNGESDLSDEQYDSLKKQARKQFPNDPYFGNIGAPIRGSKIPLPVVMGSLTQCHNQSDINKWKIGREYVISDKLDGVSCLLEYVDGKFKTAYSRGDGTEGADITRHVSQLSIPKQIPKDYALIRCEIIIPVEQFENFKKSCPQAKKYKAARNAVAGMMNAKENDNRVYPYMRAVVYEITSEKFDSKVNQLEFLQHQFSDVVHYIVVDNDCINEQYLRQYLSDRKHLSDYELDGVVVDVIDSNIRHKHEWDSTSINPGYSFKYKINADSVDVNVIGVEWNVTMYGTLSPTVLVEPFVYNGVTISRASGHNAKNIFENGIGKGSVVSVTRSGEVIPYITGVIKKVDPDMPECQYYWDKNKTNIKISNTDDFYEKIQAERIEYFANTLSIELLKEGNIAKIFEYKMYELTDIIQLAEHEWQHIVGANGNKIYKSMVEKLTNVELHKLMGAFPYFDQGLGVRKFKSLEKTIGTEAILLGQMTLNQICEVDGFDIITAEKIMNTYHDFLDFLKDNSRYITIKSQEQTSGELTDQHIVFTGFRDKNLELMVEKLGGSVKTSVSKKTTLVVAANANENSSKLNTARELGINIVDRQLFMKQIYEMSTTPD